MTSPTGLGNDLERPGRGGSRAGPAAARSLPSVRTPAGSRAPSPTGDPPPPTRSAGARRRSRSLPWRARREWRGWARTAPASAGLLFEISWFIRTVKVPLPLSKAPRPSGDADHGIAVERLIPRRDQRLDGEVGVGADEIGRLRARRTGDLARNDELPGVEIGELDVRD